MKISSESGQDYEKILAKLASDRLTRPFPVNIVSNGEAVVMLQQVRSSPGGADLVKTSAHFRGIESVLNYAHNFLSQPHEERGCRGPVCPFVPLTLKHDHLYMCCVELEGSDSVRKLCNLVESAIETFFNLAPLSGSLSGSRGEVFKALVFVFPNIPADAADVVDAVQVQMQPEAVRRGLMVGEFHAHNDTPGLKNSDWRPLRTAVPMLAIRHMVRGDRVFLVNRAKYADMDIENMLRAHNSLFCPPEEGELSPIKTNEEQSINTDNGKKGCPGGGVPSPTGVSAILSEDMLRSELAQGQLDLSPGSMRHLSEEFEKFCVKHIESNCHTGAALQGGVDLANSDLTDAILHSFVKEAGLGPEGRRGRIEERPLEGGSPAGGILEILHTCLTGPGVNTAHCGYMGHIGGGGVFTTALADYFLAAVNRQGAVRQVCPGLTRLDMNVLRWFCELAGYDADLSGGAFTSGASLSTISALICARTAFLAKKPGVSMGSLIETGCLYISAVGHGCVQKAWLLLGFSRSNVRQIPTTGDGVLDVDVLRGQVRSDREAGLEPLIVVTNAGATATGVVDDLEAVASVSRACDPALWMHTDAAYGFFYTLLNERKGEEEQYLKSIRLSDSIALDPHKSLGLPYGTGALLVKNHTHLKASHSELGGKSNRDSYLPRASVCLVEEDKALPELVDFCDYSLELSQPNRGLRVWIGLKLFGVAAFRENLRRLRNLAEKLASDVHAIPGLKVVHWPTLAIFTFTTMSSHTDRTSGETERLLRRINQTGNALITSAVVDGLQLLRVALSCFRTREEDVDELLNTIRAGASWITG
jgi:aromatic-L-amino-acid decarboxylase